MGTRAQSCWSQLLAQSVPGALPNPSNTNSAPPSWRLVCSLLRAGHLDLCGSEPDILLIASELVRRKIVACIFDFLWIMKFILFKVNNDNSRWQ